MLGSEGVGNGTKRPLSLGSLMKKKKQAALDIEPTESITVPQGDNDMEDLEAIHSHSIKLLYEKDFEQAKTYARACIHECDRIARLNEEEESLPLQFYEIFGSALFLLATCDADADCDLYKSNNQLRLEHRDLIEAAIERFELGLEEYPDAESFSQHIAIAKVRLQAITHNWYLKKAEYNPEEQFISTLTAYHEALNKLQDKMTVYERIFSFSEELIRCVEFIEQVDLVRIYFSEALKLYRLASKAIENEKDVSQEELEIYYESLCDEADCLVQWGLWTLNKGSDIDSFTKKLEKALKVLDNAEVIAQESQISSNNHLRIMAETLIHLGNNCVEEDSETYLQKAVDCIRILEQREGSLSEDLVEFIAEMEEE